MLILYERATTAEVSRPGTLCPETLLSSGQKKVSSGQKNIVLGTLFLDKNFQLLNIFSNWI